LVPLTPQKLATNATTTNSTCATYPILAIDLGKFKSVACLYRSATEQRFHSLPTSRAAITRLLE